MKRFLFCLFACSLHSLPCVAFEMNVPVRFDSLANGLKVIIVPDTNVAVVSCRLYYFVGSMYEGPGTSGLSHMFEHMMFKGTKRLGTKDFGREKPWLAKIDSVDSIIGLLIDKAVPETSAVFAKLKNEIFGYQEHERAFMKKDEIWELYSGNGATDLNAWTTDDMTAYIATLPKNKVELFYWIESDRMQNPVLREFYSERDVVAEERRMRYDNQPINRYFERLNALFYQAHPYRIPTIGWMPEIQAFTIKKMYNHLRRFYTPDNAVIVLVGNIDPAAAVDGIKRYFGPIRRAPEPKPEVVSREPAPIGEIRFTVRDNAEPRIDIMYHTPGYPNDDLYALDVVEGILSGRSGRLYNRLIIKDNLCADAGASNAFRLHDGEFQAWAVLKKDTDPVRVEKVMLEEIQALMQSPPSPREMERIKNEIRMSFISNLKSLEGLSDRLAWFQRLGGWKGLLEYPERIMAVKAEQIPGVVKKYFTPETKVIGLLLPLETPKTTNNHPATQHSRKKGNTP